MSLFRNLARGAGFGVQGFLDQAMAATFGGVLKTGGGFVSGAFKGAAGMNAKLYNKTLLGKITGGLGYGIGRVAAAPVKPIAKGAAYVGGAIGKSAISDTSRALKLGSKMLNSMTTEASDSLSDIGIGLFGKRVKRPVAWGVTAGAVALGAGSAMENHNYNFALKTAINGPMDTQGVVVAPGSISQSYTPVHKPINDHGATGKLGFALHNARRG